MRSTLASAAPRTTVVNLLDDWDAVQPAWDEFVHNHPKGSVFHSSQMVRVFAAARRHAPLPLAALDREGRVLALLSAVRVQTLPHPLGRVSSRSIWYAEPLCHDDPESVEALVELVTTHDRFVRRHTLFTEIRPLYAPGPERAALERCGYEFYDYLNYIVDLTQGEERLWTNLRKSCRRSVQSARKRGFMVRELTAAEGLDSLYSLLQQTYSRARVPLADRSLFEAAFRELAPAGTLRCMAVVEGERILAVDLLLAFKDRFYAWYGGAERMTGISPFEILQWHEFAWGVEHGLAKFDFGGAGRPDEPYGVRDFKAKFGGDLVCFGRYRKVHGPWRMALAERAYQFGRTLIPSK